MKKTIKNMFAKFGALAVYIYHSRGGSFQISALRPYFPRNPYTFISGKLYYQYYKIYFKVSTKVSLVF